MNIKAVDEEGLAAVVSSVWWASKDCAVTSGGDKQTYEASCAVIRKAVQGACVRACVCVCVCLFGTFVFGVYMSVCVYACVSAATYDLCAHTFNYFSFSIQV